MNNKSIRVLTFPCGRDRTTDRQHNTVTVTRVYLAAAMATVSSKTETINDDSLLLHYNPIQKINYPVFSTSLTTALQ